MMISPMQTLFAKPLTAKQIALLTNPKTPANQRIVKHTENGGQFIVGAISPDPEDSSKVTLMLKKPPSIQNPELLKFLWSNLEKTTF